MSGSFQIYDTIAVTTQGVGQATPPGCHGFIYQEAFERYHVATPLPRQATFTFAFLEVMSLIQMKLMRADQLDPTWHEYDVWLSYRGQYSTA